MHVACLKHVLLDELAFWDSHTSGDATKQTHELPVCPNLGSGHLSITEIAAVVMCEGSSSSLRSSKNW